ncbi:hypothetical protein JCM6882_003607, partial [Rhodosporidiobolus microsporus]
AAVNSGPLAASASSGVGAGSTSSSASFKPAPRDEVEEKRDAAARREAWGRSANLRREAELLREHHQQRREDDRYAPVEPARPYAPYPPPPSHFDHRSSYRDYQQPLSHDYRRPSYPESSSSYHDQRDFSSSSDSHHSHSHSSQHFHPQEQHFSHRDQSFSSQYSRIAVPRDEVEEKHDVAARKEAWGRSANLRREAELLREHHQRREDDRYVPSEPSRLYAPYPPPPSRHDHRPSYRDYQQPLSHDYCRPSYPESSSSYHDQRDFSSSSYSHHSHSHSSQHFHPQEQHFSHRDQSFSSHYSRSGPPNPRGYEEHYAPSSSHSYSQQQSGHYRDERGGEGPPTTRTPFHLLPLSFSLSPASLSSLSTTQLALTWIAPHPDWVEHTHWSLLFAEWRKRRERSKVERGRGNERDEDEDEEWGEDAMDRMRMDWKIPDELEKLDSAQLGALPMHPDFHPLLVEEARRVFCTRRERDLAPVPSPSPPPRQKRSSRPPQRRQNSPPVQWNNPEFVPRDFTCRWTTIFVGSVLSTLPHSVVWALLSPPNLPEPVAIRLIHKERGSPKTFALCFVAYESKREAVEACRGLDGAEYGDGEKQYRLVPEMSDKPAQAVTWEAMRLAGIDHELLSQQASSSFPLSSSLSRFIAGLPRRTNAPADTTALSVLRQAAQSSRVPSSPA